MTYDFFADESDKIELLNFIFNETKLQIFDLSSSYGEKISQYRNTGEITSKFDLQNGNECGPTFQTWAPTFKAKPIFRKVELDPKYCKGHTFRYATHGWGLIQLYFGTLQKYPGDSHYKLNHSHIGHFNKNGAMGRDNGKHINGNANEWDWKAIEQTGSKLKHFVHDKLAEKKHGTVGILKGAVQLENRGILLR